MKPGIYINKKFLVVCLVVFVVASAYLLFRPIPKPVGSCAEMNIKGFTKVTHKNKLFNPALDRNHDGVEC